MSKYICTCGDMYKTKEIAEAHVKVYENDVDGWRHKIFKQHWQARFATWLLRLPCKKISHFIGAYLIYFVLIHHFNIDWAWWEGVLIGFGIGLYVE